MSVQVGSGRMGRGLTWRVGAGSDDVVKGRLGVDSREPQTYAGSWE